jgi:hypothetical protein
MGRSNESGAPSVDERFFACALALTQVCGRTPAEAWIAGPADGAAGAGRATRAMAAQAQSSDPRRVRAILRSCVAKCPTALLSLRGDAQPLVLPLNCRKRNKESGWRASRIVNRLGLNEKLSTNLNGTVPPRDNDSRRRRASGQSPPDSRTQEGREICMAPRPGSLRLQPPSRSSTARSISSSSHSRKRLTFGTIRRSFGYTSQ